MWYSSTVRLQLIKNTWGGSDEIKEKLELTNGQLESFQFD